ncbi:hypothetical protein SprV_0100054500 [Sparganum proliferum]
MIGVGHAGDLLIGRLISVLGFTQDGVVCILMKVANWPQYANNPQELNKAWQTWNDAFFCDERIQIGGGAFIMDFEGITKSEIVKLQDPHASKLSTMYNQEAMPFRIKKLIYLNMPKFFEVFFKAASVWISEKMKSKMLMLQKDLKPAYDSVPGLEELMPSEYNGGNCSFDEICVIYLSASQRTAQPQKLPIPPWVLGAQPEEGSDASSSPSSSPVIILDGGAKNDWLRAL